MYIVQEICHLVTEISRLKVMTKIDI